MRAPFTPSFGVTGSISVSGTSASTTIATGTGNVLEIQNTGSGLCYIKYGIGAQTATTSDWPLQAGHAVLVSRSDNEATVVAAIQDSAATTVKVTPGHGQ